MGTEFRLLVTLGCVEMHIKNIELKIRGEILEIFEATCLGGGLLMGSLIVWVHFPIEERENGRATSGGSDPG